MFIDRLRTRVGGEREQGKDFKGVSWQPGLEKGRVVWVRQV